MKSWQDQIKLTNAEKQAAFARMLKQIGRANVLRGEK